MNLFIYTYTPTVSTLRNLNLIHNLANYFIENDFNNIILSTPRSSNLYRPSNTTKILTHTISSMCSFFFYRQLI